MVKLINRMKVPKKVINAQCFNLSECFKFILCSNITTPPGLKEKQREVCQHSKRHSYLCSCNDAYKL